MRFGVLNNGGNISISRSDPPIHLAYKLNAYLMRSGAKITAFQR